MGKKPFSPIKEHLGLELKLRDIFRSVSLERMRLHTENEGFTLNEVEKYHPHGYVFSNFMSLIIVSGKSIRATFKSFFNHADSKPIACRLYQQDEVDNGRSFDVMKEYCNLTAGYLKKILVEHDIIVGISLPIITRGFNEVFTSFETVEHRLTFEDCWKLESDKSCVYCAYQADIFEPSLFDSLMDFEISEDDEDDDNFDFF